MSSTVNAACNVHAHTAALSPQDLFEIETEEVGGAIVARFPNYSRLNDQMIRTVDEQLDEIALRSGTRPVVLSLCHVAGINSSMLRQIVTFNRRLAQAGGRLALCAVAPDVGDVLAKARVNSLVNIYPNEREALHST
jgi:anti-sigma B factor antagonist